MSAHLIGLVSAEHRRMPTDRYKARNTVNGVTVYRHMWQHSVSVRFERHIFFSSSVCVLVTAYRPLEILCQHGNFKLSFGGFEPLGFGCVGPILGITLFLYWNPLDAPMSQIYFTGGTLYMFRTVFPSIIVGSRLYIQLQAYVKQILLSACFCLLASRQQYLFDICLASIRQYLFDICL